MPRPSTAAALHRTRPLVILVAALAGLLALGCAGSRHDSHHPHEMPAPNRVVVSEKLVISGQPSPDALVALGAEGFGAVIYLAPPTVPDAVRDEQPIVERQGMVYVNIPIAFGAPTESDFDALAGAPRISSHHRAC